MLVILNKGKNTIWEEIEIYSQEKVYTIEETISRQEHRINECFVILNKGKNTIWEEIEIYSQEKVYTIKRLLVDKNIGLMNACNIKGQNTIWEEIEIYSSGKSIYNKETISRQEHRINECL